MNILVNRDAPSGLLPALSAAVPLISKIVTRQSRAAPECGRHCNRDEPARPSGAWSSQSTGMRGTGRRPLIT